MSKFSKAIQGLRFFRACPQQHVSRRDPSTSLFGLSRNLLWTRFCLLLYSAAVINLYCSHLFCSSLSIMSFGRPKGPKGPARGKSSRSLLCSGVASNILQSKSPCHLNLSVDFWVMRTFLSQSLAFSEHLTSGRTYLSLFPKINRVQVVSFNGAGVYLTLPLYAQSSRSIPLQR